MGNIQKNNNKSYLRKHVDLILCANAMTLIQRKIFNVFLYNALPNMQHEIFHEIKITDLAEMIGYNSRNYVLLVDSINKLASLRLECRVIDSKTKAEDIISASCSIITTIFIKDGICSYRYNDDIKSQLHHPSIYGKINLNIQASIKSSFALVLYELCEKFKGIGQTEWIEMKMLRKLMGVKDKSYKLYADFEKNVLKKASKELNKLTNFEVTFDKKREGRPVKYIKFLMAQDEKPALEGEVKHSELLEYLTKQAGFKPEKDAIAFITKHGEEKIWQQIAVIKKSKLYQKGEVRNMAAIIRDAVTKEGGYAEVKSSKKVINSEHREKVKKSEKDRREKLSQKSLNKGYSRQLDKTVKAYLAKLGDFESDTIKNEFVEYCLSQGFIACAKKAQAGDFDSLLVRPIFYKWVVDNKLQGVGIEKKNSMQSSKNVR